MLLALTEAEASLVAAGAALLGALVGGGVAGWVTLRAENRRHEHERELERDRDALHQAREERLMLGIAREMRTGLRTALGAVLTAMAAGKWWPGDLAPRTTSNEDRMAVLAKLTVDEWKALDHALLQLGNILYVRSLATRGDMPKLDAAGREALQQAVPALRQGIDALDRLCRLGPVDELGDSVLR